MLKSFISLKEFHNCDGQLKSSGYLKKLFLFACKYDSEEALCFSFQSDDEISNCIVQQTILRISDNNAP